jgi:hypothetical protein
MTDSYLGTGFNNGPTPSNPWADYLNNRKNRKHDQLMENTRHSNNVELASMQHQHAQDRDKKNYKRGRKEAGRDREWQTGERIGGQQWQTSEREGNQTFQSAENKKASRRGRKLETMKLQFDANESYLDRMFKSSDRAAAAADAIDLTRENARQGRRTVKANANVARDQAAPTPEGHRSISSFSANETGVQAVYGAPTKPSRTGGSTSSSSSSSSGTGRTLSDHPKNVKRREARAAKKANTSTV